MLAKELAEILMKNPEKVVVLGVMEYAGGDDKWNRYTPEVFDSEFSDEIVITNKWNLEMLQNTEKEYLEAATKPIR